MPFGFYLDQNCFEGDRRVEVDESYKHDTGKVQTVCIVVKRDVRSDRLDSWLQMVCNIHLYLGYVGKERRSVKRHDIAYI